MSYAPQLTISIVSHAQGDLVHGLLNDLQEQCTGIEVVLTINIEEILPFDSARYSFPIKVIRNSKAKGYGANHNAAFKHAEAKFFCVLNPDVRLKSNPFPVLMAEFECSAIGVAAPLILGPHGAVEDSARPFPTFWSIVKKAVLPRDEHILQSSTGVNSPDWVAGMFMVFRSEIFQNVGGFDERYHLYYEDVDLCARLRCRGYEVRLVPEVSALHYARHASHRNPRYLLWHICSLMRYLVTRRRVGKMRLL